LKIEEGKVKVEIEVKVKSSRSNTHVTLDGFPLLQHITVMENAVPKEVRKLPQ
jgi:ABC-type histidine transport system ATPase subunit